MSEDAVSGADRLYRRALLLAVATMVYNIVEGIVSVYFGYRDETLALFGFGLDSFVEVVSAAGIAHMVLRIRRRPGSPRGGFERLALRITGTGFFVLSFGLALTAAVNLAQGRHPETTFWGVVISLVSIATMGVLIRLKTGTGRRLRSDPVLADAACTRMCLYMSLVLLGASGLYALTGIGYVDSVGALGIAWLSLKEGRESFEKAAGRECGCGGTGCGS